MGPSVHFRDILRMGWGGGGVRWVWDTEKGRRQKNTPGSAMHLDQALLEAPPESRTIYRYKMQRAISET